MTPTIQCLVSGSPLRLGVFGLVLFGLGVIIPAGLHLLAVACFIQRIWDIGSRTFILVSLPIWELRDRSWRAEVCRATGFTLFGIRSGALSGSVLFGADTAVGIWFCAADRKFNRHILWIALAGAAGVLPLSLMKVKEPLYVLSCSIFLYFLAGMCLSALARRLAAGEALDKFSRKVAPTLVLAMLVAIPLAYAKGVQAGKITPAFVLTHSLVLIVTLFAFWWSQRRRAGTLLEASVYAACALAVLMGFTHDFATRHPRDRAIANLIEPYVKDNQPGALSFIASNFKCYQFYCFRRGCYWHELPAADGPDALLAQEQFNRVRAFVLDDDDLQKPENATWLRWLETHAQEKTGQLNAQLGSVSGYRVFIRDSRETCTAPLASAFASRD